MVISKRNKSVARRRPGRPRKYRQSVSRISRSIVSRNAPHLFKYHVNKGPLTFSTGSSSTNLGLTFSLSDIGNSAELTALYDVFKINRIIVKITPTWTNTELPSNASAGITPQIFSAIDYDDSTAPTEAQIREFGSCKESNGFRAHKRTIYPKVLTMAYKTIASTAYMPEKARYLDCADTTTPHYGLKILMNNGAVSGSGSPWSARIECIYYISMKNQC